MTVRWRVYQLACRTCGQGGSASIWSRGDFDWGHILDGFRAHAVDRVAPERSKYACNNCGSGNVTARSESDGR